MKIPATSPRWDRLMLAAAGLPALILVLSPLAWLAAAALIAAGGSVDGILDPVAVGLLKRSISLAALAALLSMLLGAPFGWLAARYRIPARPMLLAGSVLPLLLPPYCASLAWQLLLTREGVLNSWLLRSGLVSEPVSLHGCLLAAAGILAFTYWPVVAWFTYFAARSVSRPLEDAARLHVPDAQAAWWAARPALLSAVPAALLLVFLLALADFGAANNLGVTTYPVEVVNRFQLDRDPGIVARFAVPLLLLVVPLVSLQLRLLAHFPLPGSAQQPPELMRGGRWGWVMSAGCWLVLGITVGVPLAVLAAYSLPLGTYASVWVESEDYLLNTLVAGGAAAAIAVVAALGSGWAGLGRRRPLLDLGLSLSYALPGSLVGVAMIQILNRAGPFDWLYTSLWGLVWTYVALFFPFAHKTIQPALEQVDRELLDEAAVLGAGPWTQFVTAGWPVLRPYAVAAGTIVAILAAREIDATALLRVPGGDTIAFRIYDYLHFAPGPNVAALSIVLVALSALVVALLAWVMGRQEP